MQGGLAGSWKSSLDGGENRVKKRQSAGKTMSLGGGGMSGGFHQLTVWPRGLVRFQMTFEGDEVT